MFSFGHILHLYSFLTAHQSVKHFLLTYLFPLHKELLTRLIRRIAILRGFMFCKVFVAFTSAAIQIRISGLLPTSNEDVVKETSDYILGKVLKETMLNLGPTFIKSKY